VAGITGKELRDELQGGFPPGVEDFVDFDDVPGDILQAFADTIASTAVDAAERVRQDNNPLSCGTSKIGDWEADLNQSTSRTALSGTISQRRRAVVARLRENGPPTVALIQAVIGPLLDYADPSQLTVLECSRSALTAAHTYPWTGSSNYSLGTTVIVYWFVRDDALVSPTGCWIDVMVNTTNLASLAVNITTPNGTFFLMIPKLRGGASASTARIYCSAAAGMPIYGIWKAEFYTTAYFDSGTITSANLFIEGFGRDITRHDGLSAAIYQWAVMYEASKSNGNPDFDAARAAIRRLTFGTRISGLCLRSTGTTLPAGDYSPIPDDANAIPDEMVPG
jgi:hypothetical protein